MNKWLKGNGFWCPTCKGTGQGEPRDRVEYEGGGYMQFYAPCQHCNGGKRIAATPKQIIDGQVPNTPPPDYHTVISHLMQWGQE